MSGSSLQIPSAHLPRGKACVPCRRRKMKCDGTQPKCNQCVRFNRAPECEYSEGPAPSTTRVLEQHIARLQSRINEIEQDDPTLVRLHDPYRNYHASVASRPATPGHASQANWWETPDPPVQIQQALVQCFLAQSSKFGFFLDKDRFLTAFANPTASHPRPPSVLRNAVYLWGINLSGNPQYTSKEAIFLGRTLRSVHLSLSSAQQQQTNTLMLLQAEILLAYYFFHSNRLLEGKFHASAAVSLAIMCNLHRGLSNNAARAYLPPPADPIEEGERIHAWWTTFILDKSWVVGLAAPSIINETQEANAIVDTPWPSVLGSYAQHPASARPILGNTLSRFLADVTSDTETSPLALLGKAATLYDRADYLASYLDRNDANFEGHLAALDNSIEQFRSRLPPLERSSGLTADNMHSLMIIYCLCHCATIQLHRALASRHTTSMARCLTSANAVVRVICGLGQQLQIVNPLVGVLAVTAAEVLTFGLGSMRSSRSAWASSSALPGEDKITEAINHLAAAMQNFAQHPFIAAQTSKLREAITGRT